MALEWFRLEKRTGRLVEAREPTESGPIAWNERDMERVLALNPQFLGVSDQLPLCLDGKNNVTSPDQVYVDELGRISVVELKKVRAGMDAIVQALSYADHWRLLPPREIEKCLGRMSTPGSAARAVEHIASLIAQWVDVALGARSQDRDAAPSLSAATGAIDVPWVRGPAEDVGAFARTIWGEDRLPLTGASARVVVVAPDFDGTCVELAKALTARMVAVELVRVRLVRHGESVYIGRQWVSRNESSEPTWRVLRAVWRDATVRRHFAVNGWADALNMPSFSIGLRDVPEALVWFEATDLQGAVWTTTPDGWHKDDPRQRAKLRERLLLSMPPGHAAGRYPEWVFQLPTGLDAMVQCVSAVAAGVTSALADGRSR